mmetsp:Transcript_13099/g.35071  ORF Transcript_13099/g.35071 Transcript_13099/m.35071 type:complete len:302 (+) Transcript_13099:380-1285(+)
MRRRSTPFAPPPAISLGERGVVPSAAWPGISLACKFLNEGTSSRNNAATRGDLSASAAPADMKPDKSPKSCGSYSKRVRNPCKTTLRSLSCAGTASVLRDNKRSAAAIMSGIGRSAWIACCKRRPMKFHVCAHLLSTLSSPPCCRGLRASATSVQRHKQSSRHRVKTSESPPPPVRQPSVSAAAAPGAGCSTEMWYAALMDSKSRACTCKTASTSQGNTLSRSRCFSRARCFLAGGPAPDAAVASKAWSSSRVAPEVNVFARLLCTLTDIPHDGAREELATPQPSSEAASPISGAARRCSR